MTQHKYYRYPKQETAQLQFEQQETEHSENG